MKQHTLKPLFTKEEIHRRVIELSRQISSDYHDTQPVLIGVLKGAFIFLADLVRHLTIEVTVDFVQVASYGAATVSSGKCVFKKDISTNIIGRDVIIVEDIADTGETFQFLIQELLLKKPGSLKFCALLDKKAHRRHAMAIDYCGFSIQDCFVVGYGLDYNERFRSLPGIYEYIK
jgi:hypoxanthine phosphoribosyltransferase